MDKSWRREKIQSIELGSIFAAGLKSAQCGNVFRMPLGTLVMLSSEKHTLYLISFIVNIWLIHI